MNRIRIEVTTAQPGVVVLFESSYPGWRITVNGKPSNVIRLNYLFQEFEVDFRQAANSVRISTLIFSVILMDIVFHFFSYNAIMVLSPLIETQDIVNVH